MCKMQQNSHVCQYREGDNKVPLLQKDKSY